MWNCEMASTPESDRKLLNITFGALVLVGALFVLATLSLEWRIQGMEMRTIMGVNTMLRNQAQADHLRYQAEEALHAYAK